MVQPPMASGHPPAGPTPAAAATPNMGANAQASAKVREAVQILSAALAELPPGSAMQLSVSKAVTSLSKEFPEQEGNQGVQMATIRDLAQKAQQSQQMQAMMRQQQQQQPPGGLPAGDESTAA